MSKDPTEEPKLIIDEDWKTQVQREKELLKQKKAQEAAESADESSVKSESSSAQEAEELIEQADASNDVADSEDDLQPPPPASFEFLVSGMATQAVAAMGQLPGDDDKPLPVRLDYARHYIDLLGVIESKTAGNLTDSEQKFLQNTLHQLRMLFVAVKK